MRISKIIGTFVIFICLGFISFLVINNKAKEYSRDYFYMDTYINVKIYSNNKKKANDALDEIDNIYKTYHNLTDRYNSNINGLYDLNNGKSDIDYRLYEMIRYTDNWYSKTNGLLDISIGNVVDIWKKYREKGSGVPSLEELKSVNINHSDLDISDVEKKDIVSGVKLNKGIKIDLGAVSKGYTTGLVGDYLKSKGLNKYLINAGGNVLAGDHYDNKKYKIGIENPNDTSDIYQVIKANNVAVVTSGGYQRNYTYEGKTYNHIINPSTLFPANNMKSVSVICNSSAEADILSTTLFLMSIEDGKKFIKNYDAEAIWYSNDDQVIKSEGFSKYE